MAKSAKALEQERFAKQEQLAEKFVELVTLMQEADEETPLQLLGGGEKGTDEYEINRARRTMMVDDTLDILVERLMIDGVTDTTLQDHFRSESRKYLSGEGLRLYINECYRIAMDPNEKDKKSKIHELLEKLYTKLAFDLEKKLGQKIFKGREFTREKVQEVIEPTQGKKAKKTGKKRKKLELDKETRARLGFAQTTTDTFKKRAQGGRMYPFPTGTGKKKRKRR